MSTPLEIKATQLVKDVQAEALRMREAGDLITRSVEDSFPEGLEYVLDIRVDYLRAAAEKILDDRWIWEIVEYVEHAPDLVMKWYSGRDA